MPFTDTTACRAVATALLATAALALTTACHDLSVHPAGSPGGVSPAPTSTSREDGENLSPGPDGRVACTPEMLRFHAGAMPRRAHRMLLTVTNSSGRTCHFAAQRYPCCVSAATGSPPSPRSRRAGRPPRSRWRPATPRTPRSPPPRPAGRAARATGAGKSPSSASH